MEKRLSRRGNISRHAPSLMVLLAVMGLAPAAFASLVPGGGPAKSDCLVELDVTGADVTQVANGRVLNCRDGDPCDTDGACNDRCTFEAKVCANNVDPNLTECTASGTLIRLKARAKGLRILKPGRVGESCGPAFEATVPLNGERKGKLKVELLAKQRVKPKKDEDAIRLVCVEREGPCPTTTTTTLPLVCGDGVVGTGEQCDPPCGAGCAGGQLCNGSCQCVARAACGCGGPPDPMQASFVTGAGTGTCGVVLDAAGASLVVNADGTPGLDCAGLYFGGSRNAVPLPNAAPEGGLSIVNVCCSGTTLTAIGATAQETGSDRTCTARDCLFGPPLPVPNLDDPSTSTCVVNRLASSARGSGDCVAGTTDLAAPLGSEIFLTGDSLFDCVIGQTTPPGGRCVTDADCGTGGYCATGIQPCPICRGAPGSAVCVGGANDGMVCTPGTTSVGAQYPTSHDCPPIASLAIGTLPIGFSLSSGTVERRSVALGTPRVFCGFCRDGDDTGCFEGNVRSARCPEPIGEAHPCDSNEDCAQPYESCEQNQPGAFAPGGGSARTIRLFGSPAGDSTDRQPHPGTLASIFCIQPTYDALIDNAANLPGPGAVTLPGTTQLLPALGP